MFRQDGAIGPKQFPCGRCGGQVSFAPGAHTLVCDHCGDSQTISSVGEDVAELDYAMHLAQLESEAPVEDILAVHCAACGADIQPGHDTLAMQCPFCAASLVGVPQAARHLRPNGILPFATTVQQAHDGLRRWLNDLWFAPARLKSCARREGPLSGVYIPYWVFSCVATSFYSGRRGTHSVDRNGHSHIRWQNVVGWIKDVLSYVRIMASSALPQGLAESLEPWDLARLEPYDDSYLSGFRAEHHRMALADGFEAAKVKIEHRVRVSAMADMGGDHQEIKSIKSQFDDVRFQLVLMPVWVCAYRFKDRVYQVLVNGRTGEVVGDRPYDGLKIAGAVLSALLVACGIGCAVMWLATRNGGITGGLIN